jgi:hypothetical protein
MGSYLRIYKDIVLGSCPIMTGIEEQMEEEAECNWRRAKKSERIENLVREGVAGTRTRGKEAAAGEQLHAKGHVGIWLCLRTYAL